MTDFLLHLSADALSMDQRAPTSGAAAGWYNLGQADFSSSDFETQIQSLAKHPALDGVACAAGLILPTDQIKLIDLGHEVADASEVEAALEGQTPYEVDELAYAWLCRKGMTHIAAVARETLTEAEEFAKSYGFAPTSFLALPRGGWGLRFAFFGLTDDAPDGTTPPKTPYLLLEKPSEAAPTRVRLFGKNRGMGAKVDATPETPSEPQEDTPTKPTEPETADATEQPVDLSADSTEPAPPVEMSDEYAQEEMPPADLPDIETTPEKEEHPETLDAGGTGIDNPDESAVPPTEPEQTPTRRRSAKTAGPVLSARRTTTPGDQGGAPKSLGGAVPVFTAAPRPNRSAEPVAPALDTPSEDPDTKETAAPPILFDDGVIGSMRDPVIQDKQKKEKTEDDQEQITPVPVPDPNAFNSLQGTTQHRSRYLGLILTALLILFMLAVAALASESGQRIIAALFGGSDNPVESVAVSEPPAPTPNFIDQGEEAPTASNTTEPVALPSSSRDEPTGAEIDTNGIATTVLAANLEHRRSLDQASLDTPMRAFGGPATVTELARLPDAVSPAGIIPNTFDDAAERAAIAETAALNGRLALPSAPSAPDDDPLADQDILSEEEQAEFAALTSAQGFGEGENAEGSIFQSEAAILRRYAATGVWIAAPEAPYAGEGEGLNLYQNSLDPRLSISDALALPSIASLEPDQLPFAPTDSPSLAVAGLAPLDGSVGPQARPRSPAIRLIAGPPPLLPPLRGGIERSAAAATPATPLPDAAAQPPAAAFAAFRPQARPAGTAEQTERDELGGFSREELAKFRPQARPVSAQESLATDGDDAPTEAAVLVSLRPNRRTAAIEEQGQRDAASPAIAAAPSETVGPTAPSRQSVTRAATIENAVNLRRISLIGIAGRSGSRRALVRLPNGRISTVRVGDSLDGGRVAAIGETQLRYVKQGRNVVLEIPTG